jgi:3-dehydroquinate synthase
VPAFLQSDLFPSRLGNYPVHYPGCAAELAAHLEETLGNYSRVFWVSDAALLPLLSVHWPELHSLLNKHPFWAQGSGESLKTPVCAYAVHAALSETGIDRQSVIVALGGGSVTDLAGFVAGTYFRGIPYINIPTTLVGMIDSALGGKTGINLPGAKNAIGVFHPPKAIYTLVDFLKSLPAQTLRGAFGEVIKYALIGGGDFFETLEQADPEDLNPQILHNYVQRCVHIKGRYVALDEDDTQKIRTVLNLGHTFAHALESALHYTQCSHGEATALGIYLACQASEALCGLSPSVTQRVLGLLQKYQLPTSLSMPVRLDTLMANMSKDKKQNQSTPGLNLILLQDIGNVYWHPTDQLALIRKLWLQAGAEAPHP